MGDEDAELSAKRKAAGYVGKVVSGRYRVDAVIALGGMGAVFRAEHVHMRKQVALKLLHPTTQNLPELVTRFERESIVGAHVTHPNVCQATDFGRLEDGSHYLVLEHVEGRTLHDVLRDGPMDPVRAAEIAMQIAAGLGAAHRLGIFHRDVKPSNVMLVEVPGHDGGHAAVEVKIVDFGLAKLPPERFRVDEKISVTTAGTVFGTVAYMAPELANGMAAVDHRSDLYALGVILYQMLAGKHPFDATEPTAQFRQHCLSPVPRIADRAPGVHVPPALEVVTRKLLEKKPADRYQSADELIVAIVHAVPELADRAPASRAKPSVPPASTPRIERASRDGSADPSDATPAAAQVDGPAARPASRGAGRTVLAIVGVLVVAAAGVRFLAPDALRSVGLGPATTQKAQVTGVTSQELPSPGATATSPATPPTASAARAAETAPAVSTTASNGPSASAATASAASPEIVRLRGSLNEAAAMRDPKRGATALLALATAAPAAFRDADVVASTAGIAVALEIADAALADQVFGVLGGAALGESGPDILHYITSFHGGSRGAARAAALLAKPDVMARASAALRILRELKSAPCKDRGALFDRAASDGDERTLVVLAAMQGPVCDEGSCCTPHDPRLVATLAKLRGRLRK